MQIVYQSDAGHGFGGAEIHDGGAPSVVREITVPTPPRGWIAVSARVTRTEMALSVDGREVMSSFLEGFPAFTSADVTLGLNALTENGPWSIFLDNVVCDAL